MSEDPATAENLRALRLKISGDENGLSHHSDRSLSRFLRAKKTLEPAAKLLGKYEELVEEKGYRSLTFEDVKDDWEKGAILCFPEMKDKEGRTIMWLRTARLFKGDLSKKQIQRLVFFTIDWLTTTYERTQTDGIIAVADWTGFSVFSFNPAIPKTIMPMITTMLPVRPKVIAHVNAGAFFSIFFSMVSPLLSSKLKERIRVIEDTEHLKPIVDDSMIPTEMGGSFDFPYDKVKELLIEGKSHTANPVYKKTVVSM